jgi:hypothetical protein
MVGCRTPFSVRLYRVARARPFKNVMAVQAALAAYRQGDSIGYSRRSSLVAMGLLPRADGYYRLSQKYE